MCEFTVFLDGHDDENIVAERVIKATLKDDHLNLIDSEGRVHKVPNAAIVKVDTIMAEMALKTIGK